MATNMKILSATLLVIATLVGCTGVWADNTSPTVQTNSGEVIGQVEKSSDGESVYSFKGIPYAQADRWESPEDPAPWSEPLDATKYGAQCAQPSEEFQMDVMGFKNLTKYDVGLNNDDIVFPDIETSEDCLFLNVFTPSLNESSKNESSNGAPVMVWIHGGALFVGSGADDPPQNLAAKGVVVVTINYRLGLLGYFAHPDLNGTNFGLQDQVKALEWVKNNIADFGGNPDQVTIFGESAGAGSVLALMVSPLSEGLFAGAIAESAPPIESPDVSMSEAGKVGLALGDALNISAGSDQLDELRARPWEDIVDVNEQMFSESKNAMSNIYVDNYSMDASIYDSFMQGLNHKVPLLLGTNANETAMFGAMGNATETTVGEYQDMVKAEFTNEEDADKVLADFPATTDEEAWGASVQVGTAQIFGGPDYYIAESLANRSEPVFFYHFTQVPDGADGSELGAFHGSELSYVFDNPGLGVISNPDLADTMQAYWVQFARSGDPNEESVPQWPAFDGTNWQILGPQVENAEIPSEYVELYDLGRSSFVASLDQLQIA